MAQACKEVKDAFLDLMDNLDWEDVRRLTGLPDERCQEIYQIFILQLALRQNDS